MLLLLSLALQKLLSEVKVAVSLDDQAVGRYRVSVTPVCPPGSTAEGQGCLGVRHNQTVSSTQNKQLRHRCPTSRERRRWASLSQRNSRSGE